MIRTPGADLERIQTPKVRDGAIDDRIAREVLEKRGLKSPVSVVKAQPLSAFK